MKCRTTTEMTSSWAASVGYVLGFGPENRLFDYLLRSVRINLIGTYWLD